LAPAAGAVNYVGQGLQFTARHDVSNPSNSSYPLYAIVSSSPATDANGELKRDQYFQLQSTPGGDPAVVSNTSPAAPTVDGYFLNAVGTYYWQAFAIDCSAGPSCHRLSQVQSFSVAETARDQIPASLGRPGNRSFVVNDTYGPAVISQARFLLLAQRSGERWGNSFAGATKARPHRDGIDEVGFSYAVPGGLPAFVVPYFKVKVRRICSHQGTARRCRRIRRLVPTGERDILINANFADRFEQGPAHPSSGAFDLETILLAEFGLYSGNPLQAKACDDSPLQEPTLLFSGDYWHSPTEWFRHGCGNPTLGP
jgi:hypothetical protein